MRWPTEIEQIREKARRDAALTPAERTEAFAGLLMLVEEALRTSPVRDRQLRLYREEEEHRAWRSLIGTCHAAGNTGRDAGTDRGGAARR